MQEVEDGVGGAPVDAKPYDNLSVEATVEPGHSNDSG